MKMSKKWFSVILVGALSIGLIAPVSAQQTDQTEATITINDGALEFDSATEYIVFKDIVFSFDEELTATSNDNIELQITDNRFSAATTGWNLQANLTGFAGLGEVLIEAKNGSAISVSHPDGFTMDQLELTTKASNVYNGGDLVGTSNITYLAESITVTVEPGSESPAETQEFNGSILWTLSNTATDTE